MPTPTHVQSTGSASTAGVATQDTTFASTTTSGNLLIVGVASNNGSVTWTITDTYNNTWVQVDTYHNSGSNNTRIAIFYAKNCVGGANHKITVTPSATSFVTAGISEYSTIATGTALDSNTTGNTGNDGAPTSSTVTVNNANDLVWGWAGTDSGANPFNWAATGSFNLRYHQENGAASVGAASEDIVTSAGIAAQYTGTSAGWVILAASFIAGAAPSTPPKTPLFAGGKPSLVGGLPIQI